MICKRCKKNTQTQYIRNGICVFCINNKDIYDNGHGYITKGMSIIKKDKKYYQKCKNLDSNGCVLWSACNECYYYEEELICPFCERKVPNKDFFINGGCKWCQKS